MLDAKKIDELATKLSQILPPELGQLRHDLQKNFRQLLQNALSQLDFVTREEFDVQARVLENAQHQLAEVTQQLAVLEKEHLGS